MKKTKTKKLLSLVLAVVIMLSAIPLVFANAVSQIPSDAVKFNGHYYKVYENELTWKDAREFCEHLGGHLATITSQEENNFIASITPNAYYYTGGTDQLKEGEWQWVTGENWDYSNWCFGEPNNGDRTGIPQHYSAIYGQSDYRRGSWDDSWEATNGFVCEWDNIYNLGEETYSFGNYVDLDSKGGHCFGMSVTSSGYHLGILDVTDLGIESSSEVNTLSDIYNKVRIPICYYQNIQGSIRDTSMVAGGTNYKDENKIDIETDWNEVVNYVKNHEYDDRGSLQIGYRKSGEGGHSINFLRYEEVDGQARIYAYDNNCPTNETYFYQDENGEVRQAVYSTFSGPIDCITLRDIATYLSLSDVETSKKYIKFAIYASPNISIMGAVKYLMEADGNNGEYYVYELPKDIKSVRIIPLVDNATFTYMNEEYRFGEINKDTYAELTLSTSEEDAPEFEIINAPEDEQETKDCSCNCHKGGIAGFFFKIIIFFQRIFGMNKECKCGIAHY